MSTADPAEELLLSLGITEPDEIDLDAIAFDQGAHIRFCDLDGCEADILGYRDKAIISIDRSRSKTRKRFSIAHELGHWHHHRGQRLRCRVEEHNPNLRKFTENQANTYAASLLLPTYLLKPRVIEYTKFNFSVIENIAIDFNCSLSATALRLVEQDYWPSMLVCHSPTGRQWFARSKSFHQRWFPKTELDPESGAFDVLFGQAQNENRPHLIGADAWFDSYDAQRFEMYEQTIKISREEILSLLTIKDDRMLEDPESFRRSRF